MPPLLGGSRHLSPFALYTAFPCSLDGRDAVDSYEDSVTLGLAPRRRSRVPFGPERLEHDVGVPLLPLPRFALARLSGAGYGAHKSHAPLLTASPGDAVAKRVRFHRWGWGCRPSSFRPILRALQDGTIRVFWAFPLFRHALVPSGFRLEVHRMAQRSPFAPLLTGSRIQSRVPRRTLSPHTALQESAFHMAACCTACVIRFPFPACPHQGSHGACPALVRLLSTTERQLPDALPHVVGFPNLRVLGRIRRFRYAGTAR